jgi:hypothetical protein
MRKGTHEKYVEPNLATLLSEGVAFHLFAFIGFPGESKAEALNTAYFLQRMGETARTTYGMRFCSHGLGVFGLDRFSPVAQNPSDFGVKLLSPVAPLSLQLPYEVKSGMSGNEAAELLNSLANHQVTQEIEHRTNRHWLHSATKTQLSREEWNFLALCFQEDEVAPARRGPQFARTNKHHEPDYTWNPPRTSSQMTYDPATARFRSEAGFAFSKINRGGDAKRGGLQFHPETEIVKLEDETVLLVNHYFESALILNSSAQLAIALLTRFDLISDMVSASDGVLDEGDIRVYMSQLEENGFLIANPRSEIVA